MPRLDLPPDCRFPVWLVAEMGVDKSHLEEVAGWFERHPGPVGIHWVRRPTQLALDGGVFAWSTAFARIAELRTEHAVPSDGFVMLVTKSPNENNWYAVQDPANMRNCFGHVDDFRWVTSAPGSAITVHYILKSIFNALVTDAGLDWMELWHLDPRGCFFDFCAIKDQLNLKLRTADICGDCLEVFREIGIPDALLVQTVALMESARPFALKTGQYRAAESNFDRWPFPVAVTRHKVVQAANPLLKFLLLLDHFDSLIRYFWLTREILADRRPVVEDRPSLGWWLDQLAHSLKGEKNYRDVIAIAQRENVVSLRNERRGHGWMSADAEAYVGESARLERIVTEIETELAPFFTRHCLVIPRQIELRDSGYVVIGERLTGSHLLHPPLEAKLATDPRSAGITKLNEVYVADARLERFQSMSPFIRAAMCPTCHHPRLLITDGEKYIDIFMGHRVVLAK